MKNKLVSIGLFSLLNSFLNFSRGIIEFLFLFLSLESTVSQFRWSINEFQVDLFHLYSLSSRVESFSQNQSSLLGSYTTSFDNEEIVSDKSVVRESSERVDIFLGQIVFSGSVVSFSSFTNFVDSFVNFSSMMETVITSSGNGPRNLGWMPCSNTTDFSQTSMCFSLQFLCSESLDNSSNSVSFSDSENINNFTFFENLINGNFFFKQVVSEINLLSNVSPIDLDFIDVGFFLSLVEFVWLGVTD